MSLRACAKGPICPPLTHTMLYVMPMHVGCIALNLLYVHYHNVIDHSGIYHESALPWQPSSLYHDDHHKLFHLVSIGITLDTRLLPKMRVTRLLTTVPPPSPIDF